MYCSNTFTINTRPFYDQYNQCYKNVLTLDVEPCGPIRSLVRNIQFPRLSPFQQETPCNPIQKCGLVLQSLRPDGCCKYNNGCNLMTPDEMPELISFLLGNRYQIETQITNMLNQSSVKQSNKKLNFVVTYYPTTQPNITYTR